MGKGGETGECKIRQTSKGKQRNLWKSRETVRRIRRATGMGESSLETEEENLKSQPGVTMPAPGFPDIDNGDSLTEEMESKRVRG